MYIPGPEILFRQRKWAAARGIKPVAGNNTSTVEENLFQPLNPDTKAEYEAGGGHELGSMDKPGNMYSLGSSSALVCNVFDYWRNRPLRSLAAAFGAPTGVDRLRFEQIYPTSIGSRPHLDVALYGDKTKPFFIESKFTEPYRPYSAKEPFKNSYFPDNGELWGKLGLPRCEDLARRVGTNQEQFSLLYAPQLLKHILGLANHFGKDFTLLYLWYDYPSSDYPSSEAAKHRAEVETFMLRLNGEIDFRAMTYQELFQKMQGNPAVDEKYITYLKDPYFA